MRIIGFIFILTLFSHLTYTQKDSTRIQSQYFSISSQNDFYQYWLQSDKHFTNGSHFTLAHKVFNNHIMDWFLIGLKNATNYDFSLAVGQDMHTPANWELSTVDSSDRPYAGLLYFTYTKTSIDFWKTIKLITNFYVGIQGPAALGGKTQNLMHRIFIDNVSFNGWHNQIGNGLILDYHISIQKMTPLTGNFYETNVLASLHAGTIYNYILGGVQFKIGKYNDSYYSKEGVYQKHAPPVNISDKKCKTRKRLMNNKGLGDDLAYYFSEINQRTQVYFFSEFHIGNLFYDGTAQGSLIQFEPSPYILKSDQIDPLILNLVYGFNFSYKRWMLRYYRIIENDSFKKGQLSGWGEISIYYSL
jgi:lipid A 3-O-deacylase